jgi:hypothetical protein
MGILSELTVHDASLLRTTLTTHGRRSWMLMSGMCSILPSYCCPNCALHRLTETQPA